MEREFSFASGFRLADKTMQEESGRQPRPAYRAVILMLIATTLMSLHVGRLVQLQLVEGKQYRERAENNRIRLVPVQSNRGHILDRKGRSLAANRLARSVYLWPKEQTREQWKTTANKLSALLNIPANDIIYKLEQIGYQSYRPVRISQSLTAAAFVSLGERATEFPGVEVQAESSRYYPNGELAAHVLGYIGEATAEDLKAHPQYPMGMIIGQMGIEASANSQIAGVWGNRLIEVNARGEELQELGVNPPTGGANVELTLDLDLQKAAEQALGNRRGAVAAVNVKTGAVLVLASHPTFDPNLFTRKVSKTDWDRLLGEEQPFLNRSLQGYPPGSTFKIITTAAGLESGKFSPDSILGTSAFITVGGFQFNEHSGGYGYIGFRDALAVSSNTFYYQVGMAVGPEQIAKWGHLLGIGQTDFKLLGLTGGSHGQVPTPEEKEKRYGEPWYLGDTVTMAIGQGLVLTTPLEASVVVASVVNGGYRIKPHLLAALTNTPATKPQPTGIKPDTLKVIRDGLVAVVENGTASQVLNDGSIPLTGGKTGTSEVIGQPSHSWYVAFGPADKPEIAIAVVVENGGFGAVSAAPVAKEVFKAYFNQSQKSK